ncbi:MAG TPA: methylenetetrahydrofolate--tRNA-(uracil(54)-C(5))-methyltransferase (FADH(2)-oxidizing) TrmFO [Deltaproteobacteria bacterium]|nr:MAG: methylenetetrahydrofolate--tRNA-(uracil(54)-C(5))-methyltransferase (FADH(2)-oxidizing) TrmFO [Deltaproteobacteria bacterium GWA2_45_12]HBF13706.1 methylenetetrahydrofolate--tRNA-(uracil(54)-C(5))-methyltransferase (FADH(2)-oxidizing) TrmFO [Deltaproteobacteria bacterium]
MSVSQVTIVGGGLAGSEAALQLANQNIPVTLYEMRPIVATGAHTSEKLAEIVCSNSLGSQLPDRASGLLKDELKILGSQLLKIAEETKVPAGNALAVDREAFSAKVTKSISCHPFIRLIREEIKNIPAGPVIIASGPLTSQNLALDIQKFTGNENLFFFDAIAPIVTAESIDTNIAYRASRYDENEGDYINCPFTKDQYENFVAELLKAERIPLKSFEECIAQGVKAGAHHFFEGCLPVEIIASRGEKSLAFGPMRPVGLNDPKTGQRPYAVVQLRQDNVAGTLFNLVGFQTNLKIHEQERIFRMIPGLANAEFVRYGQMHRNTFISSPKVLNPTLQARNRNDLFFAGQITGVEGYMGNIATGLFAGLNMARFIKSQALLTLPPTTMLGALCHYITHADLKNFQPMKANFGILPQDSNIASLHKKERGAAYAARALEKLKNALD